MKKLLVSAIALAMSASVLAAEPPASNTTTDNADLKKGSLNSENGLLGGVSTEVAVGAGVAAAAGVAALTSSGGGGGGGSNGGTTGTTGGGTTGTTGTTGTR